MVTVNTDTGWKNQLLAVSEVLTEVKISIMVFCVMMPCTAEDDYKCFGGTYPLHFQGSTKMMFIAFKNDTFLTSQPVRLQLTNSTANLTSSGVGGQVGRNLPPASISLGGVGKPNSIGCFVFSEAIADRNKLCCTSLELRSTCSQNTVCPITQLGFAIPKSAKHSKPPLFCSVDTSIYFPHLTSV
jgi:hypothetical protein